MPDAVQHGAPSEEPFLEMDTEGRKGNLSTTILILLIILVLLIAGFLTFYKYSLSSKADDKLSSFNGLVEEINTADKQKARDKAVSIESAISILKTASKTKYSFKGFIDELTKKITNDSRLSNLSIDEEGGVTMDGVSSSYRNVADLAVALESSKKIEKVNISSLSKGSDEGKEFVAFSITAEISDWDAIPTSGSEEPVPAIDQTVESNYPISNTDQTAEIAPSDSQLQEGVINE